MMKTAIVEITCEQIGECLSLLQDHGFLVLSATSEGAKERCIRFKIGDQVGDLLPLECGSKEALVRIEVESWNYGKQRMTRVSKVSVVNEA